MGYQIVDHQIETQSWRGAISGGVAEEDRAKFIACQTGYILFNQDFRMGIWCNRIEIRFFSQKLLPEAPYMLQDDENRKRAAPASFARRASRTVAR